MLDIQSFAGGNAQLKYQTDFKSSYKPDVSDKITATDSAKSAVSDVAPSAKPRAATKPVDMVTRSFESIFHQVDLDKNGLVTAEELTTVLKEQGASQDQIDALISNVLGRTTDVNGDGLSLSELQRRLRIDSGDNFSLADLNGDNQITTEELDQAIALYTKYGNKFDEAQVRSFFANADLNSDTTLTRVEFDTFNKYGRTSDVAAAKPVPADASVFEALFHQFDADNDGHVSREELISGLKEQGVGDKDAEALIANIFSRGTDVNGDDKLSLAELRRRLLVDKGDSFAVADLNNDNQITAEELDQAIALYNELGVEFSEKRVRRIFAGADADGNSILTRAELEAFGKSNRPTTVVAAAPVADAEPPVNAKPVPNTKPLPDAKPDAVTDAVAFKPKLPPISPAVIDSQLILLLQDKA